MKKPRLEKQEMPPKLVEGVDYYFEDGLMVLTAHFLKNRGYCCGNGCRHCPFDQDGNTAAKDRGDSIAD